MWYSDEYSSWRFFVDLLSVVVTFERTWVFHASCVAFLTVSREVPAGISELTLLQACSVDMNETPTRDVTTLLVSSLK